MTRTTQAVLIAIGIITTVAFWGLVIRPSTNAQSATESNSLPRILPPEYQTPEFPTAAEYSDLSFSETRRDLSEAVANGFEEWNLDAADRRTIREGVSATIGLLNAGDTEAYTAYRFAFNCTVKPSAAAVANRHFNAGRIPDIEESQWNEMSALDKFKAAASIPDSRDATILKAAAGHVQTGLGQRGSIPEGYRVQGLVSGFAPPSPDLFLVGADTEWAWAEIPIKIDAADEAILRFEFVRDPAVNAWLLQRASVLAPQSVKIPWIMF